MRTQEKVRIEIRRYALPITEPAIHIFEVRIEHPEFSWVEMCKSDAELNAFLRGVQAGTGIIGHPHIPEECSPIPEEFKDKFFPPWLY